LKEINGVLVLNDSYNANPASMQAAIDLAKSVSHPGKTWLLLGDMLELGATAQEAHRKLLANAVNGRTEILLRGSIFKSCLDEGPAQPGAGIWFASHEALAAYLNERLHPGDLILVKGSRGLQMEKIIEQIKYAG
jgi:UDP-N-acetylmuramyl pentapeptide synthase